MPFIPSDQTNKPGGRFRRRHAAGRGVYEILNTDEYPKKLRTEEQAIRVSWRILHSWIKAQLALVEVNLVTIPQVFLPYSITKNGQTLWEKVSADPGLLLE